MPRFITQALSDEPLTIHGDGHASRDWLYVDDDAEAIEAMIAAPIDARRGRGPQRRDRRRHLRRRDRRRSCSTRSASRRDLKRYVDERPGQVDRHIGSTDKAERLLGWRARTSFEEGLERTVAWYRDNEAWWRASARRRERRLLVLGAGPAQLGLLAGRARARALRHRRRPRPGGARLPLADRRAIISAEDEPGIERLAAAERVDGIIAPGIDWPVAIAARVAERLALPHPISPATAVLATVEAPPARALRRGRACRSRAAVARRRGARRRRSPLRRQGARPAGPARAVARARARRAGRRVRARARPRRAPARASSRSSSTGRS